MALSIIGRYNIGNDHVIHAPVQDLDDPDTLYFIMQDTTTHLYWLWKFKWPNTLTAVANVDAYINALFWDCASITKDVSSMYGELSSVQHYCFAPGGEGTRGPPRIAG